MGVVELMKRNEGKALEFKRDLSSPEGILKCLTIERYSVRVSQRATGACRFPGKSPAGLFSVSTRRYQPRIKCLCRQTRRPTGSSNRGNRRFGILLFNMPKVLIAGGGLAGLAAAAALGRDGWDVDLFEARPYLGGRATSYAVPAGGEEVAETIDNCQHVLLRWCVNPLGFYQRLGVRERIRFYREFYFIEPGGRISVLQRGRLPAPLHFAGSFLRMKCFSAADKMAIGRGLIALRRERTRRKDLDRISMLDWLLQKRQTPHAIDRFWRQVLVSAVNEDLDRMAAVH